MRNARVSETLASLGRWRDRSMAISSLYGIALEAKPLAEKDRDHTLLMRAMHRGRLPIAKQPRERPVS
jgi:hypothetical protein